MCVLLLLLILCTIRNWCDKKGCFIYLGGFGDEGQIMLKVETQVYRFCFSRLEFVVMRCWKMSTLS